MSRLREFWHDERDYYGDLKATLIYLAYAALQVLFVVSVYAWMGKL